MQDSSSEFYMVSSGKLIYSRAREEETLKETIMHFSNEIIMF